MKRAASLARRNANGTRERGVPLDATALEAIDRFARVLASCGSEPQEISKAFVQACARLPRALTARRGRAQRELSNAPHILTVWFSDALYLDRAGKPIWLRVRGTAPSLEALVARVDSSLDVDEVVRYLRRTNALRRSGSRYAPRKRALSLRGAQGPDAFRNLRSLTGLLRTLEHNMRPRSTARSWFEYFAENPTFPARSREAFDTRLDELGMNFLHAVDADMHRREIERQPGEPTVRMGVGVYRFEDESPGDSARPSRRSTGTRARKRKKERRSV